MADKVLKVGTTGVVEEYEGLVTSAGAGDAGKIVALDTDGKLNSSVMPTGIGAETKVIAASEDLAANDFVNLWSDAGTLKVRKADASDAGKQCDGFVKAVVTSGQNATVYFDGLITGMSSLTVGSKYFLSATPGTASTSVITSAGDLHQFIGKAISATEMTFEPQEPIIRA